jgi:cell division protein FtsB
VAELADALRSGRSEPWAHEGSTPSFGTAPADDMQGFLIPLRFFCKWYNCCNLKGNTGHVNAMKKLIKDKRVVVVVLVIVLVLLLMDFNQRMVLLSKLRSQEDELTQKYANLVATRDALNTELAYANSDEAVEKWAREEAGMIQEGDIPIVLVPPSTPAATEPAPQEEVIDEVQPWEIWQELFFGD